MKLWYFCYFRFNILYLCLCAYLQIAICHFEKLFAHKVICALGLAIFGSCVVNFNHSFTPIQPIKRLCGWQRWISIYLEYLYFGVGKGEFGFPFYVLCLLVFNNDCPFSDAAKTKSLYKPKMFLKPLIVVISTFYRYTVAHTVIISHISYWQI